jgi:hypothetical protein
MEQLNPGGGVLARIAAPFVNGIKRVVTDIGILTDKRAYKDEIVRYEGTLELNAGRANESEMTVEADGREAVIS